MADVVSFDVDTLARGQTPRESSLGYSLTRSDEREKAAIVGGKACRVLFPLEENVDFDVDGWTKVAGGNYHRCSLIACRVIARVFARPSIDR